LNILKLEIEGKRTAFYSHKNEKDLQVTLLASRCLNLLAKSISQHLFKVSTGSPWSTLWVQNDSQNSVFNIEDADYLNENYGVSINCNWCV
jgi:hypothetical protein